MTPDSANPESTAAEPVKQAEPPARAVVVVPPPPPFTPKVAAKEKPVEEPTKPTTEAEPAPVTESLPIIEPLAEPVTVAEPAPASEPGSGPALKLAASKSRGMTPSELAPHVAAMLEAHGPDLSQVRIKRDLHVSTDKAREALALAKGEQADEPLAEVRNLR